MKARELFRLLERIGYSTLRQTGSHRRMIHPSKPPLTFAFHDGDEVGPALVRRILMSQAGLTDDEVRELL